MNPHGIAERPQRSAEYAHLRATPPLAVRNASAPFRSLHGITGLDQLDPALYERLAKGN
jgi:hypothetical protein